MRRKGFALILVVIVMAVIAIIGVYYLGNKKENALPTFTQTSISVTPEPVKTIGSTEKWKLYSNQDWNISFEYPNEEFIITESESEIFIGYKEPQYVPYLIITKKDSVNLDALKVCEDLYNQDIKSFPCLAGADSTEINKNQIGLKVSQVDTYTAKSAYIYYGAFEAFYRVVQIKDRGIELKFYTTPNRFVPATDRTIETFKFTQ